MVQFSGDIIDLSDGALRLLGLGRRTFDTNGRESFIQTEFIRSLINGMAVELDFSSYSPEDSEALLDTISEIAEWCTIASRRVNFTFKSYRLYLTEILKNAVLHGNKMDFTLPVFISLDKYTGRLTFWDTTNPALEPEVNASWGGVGVGVSDFLEKSGRYIRITNSGLTEVVFIFRDNALLTTEKYPAVRGKPDLNNVFEHPGIYTRNINHQEDFAENGVQKNNGGIDLNPSKIDMATKSNGEEVNFNMDSAMLERLQNASGVTPVIISIHSLDSLSAFMGQTTKQF